MSKAIITIKKPGLATSIQDGGRYGYQRFGVVSSGAMDRYALNWANALVGNPLNAACLEICLVGPSLVFHEDVSFSICGANLSPHLNGQLLQGWRTYKAKAGEQLSFGRQVDGNYAYLAVKGGLESEVVMGSQSTYTKAELGTAITEGLTIWGNPQTLPRNRGLITEEIPKYEDHVHVHYIPGPHQSYIKEDSIQHFEEQSFLLQQGDRMGFRLKGTKPIETKNYENLSSNPIPLGGIQLPPDGNPIILLADRQTTGGYPRIGTVISTDLSKIVQLSMGKGTIGFTAIAIEEAQLLFKQKHLKMKLYTHI
ncbi:antagonist of KipI [Bacillus mesophilus]|uniref:Biotin-dependent carboxyltransferase n=1 Tax=Bacillus mesophilus TaxID=1808955 RepID=A0A6M0Q9J4_9BACI|nr:biotin-dependent carboxyltransferase family protein [Bacillus mesophilus]MBM7662400.1 antagonist of KipI [Bacillus mesophilus]NEY72973.1 biotin-dependent carboxyltransferase [Bacillus mesophilus]